jgi:ArsR family transcriptional regulator, arsenate/arsenite/antimonite-responsive transcriptional repressor / arsenate reductase (thioredoxin)
MSIAGAELSPTEFLQLVADPQRWQLLTQLAASDRRVGELTELVGKPQNLVSYHLAQLRESGLVTVRRSSADRRDSYYRVDLLRFRDLLGATGATLHPGLQLTPAHTAPARSGKKRAPVVLFLCTGNSARSQMAEALLEHRSARSFAARSAGSHPKPLHPNAVRVMAEKYGIDISGRPTKHLDRFARSRFDRVITLCDKVKEICPEFPGQPASAHWSMPDPASQGRTNEESYPAFRHIAEDLDVRISLLIDQMTTEHQKGRPRAR